MALRFNIETHEHGIRFNVKGTVVELAYHAASALCNAIMEACSQRKEFATTKYQYWKVRAQHGFLCDVSPENRKQYKDFIKSLNIDISTLKKKQRPTLSPEEKKVRAKEYRKERYQRMLKQREESKAAKIRELQKRFHITPKK